MIPLGPRTVGFDATPLEVVERSGVSRYAAQLLTALVDRRDDRRYALLASRSLRGAVPAGTIGHVGPRLPNRWLWMQVALPPALARLRPELCHFTNSMAPLLAPCPCVMTLHDLSLFLQPSTQPWKSRILIRSLIPLAASRAAAVITVSESARDEIVSRLGLAPQKVHVVHEAASPAYRVLDRHEELEGVRRRYALDDPFILSVGTREPRKNLSRLLAAFACIRAERSRLKLVIAGRHGWGPDVLDREVRRLDLQNAVRFLGFVPDDDLPALYNLALALAYPSLYEGFGLPVVESMACGTPVVTSDRSAMAEVARGAALLVDPLNIAALSDALRTIVRDETRREALREAGLRRAAQFSWTAAAAQTVDVYDAVTRARGGTLRPERLRPARRASEERARVGVGPHER